MKAVVLVILGLFIVGGYFVYRSNSETKRCEDQALNASVEEYRPSQYPNTDTRATLQKEYQARYVEACKDIL